MITYPMNRGVISVNFGSVYNPLMEKRSVAVGSGENFSPDLQDAGLVFDVIKGLGSR
jgi:hypothetical protein